tara:strand:- start:239 stop:397 length:159 start_codon:yes stop_codon:yes gene_type:complete
MYKLKKQYKGVVLNRNGYQIRLDNVNPTDVVKMGLERYFTKSKKDTFSTKDK